MLVAETGGKVEILLNECIQHIPTVDRKSSSDDKVLDFSG